ncbi:hypothetical protein HMPREF9102_0404 [Limosilactobacillus oris F0423]|uniref:Uncharacterized protein n=1 Tax=Limosilactobacillus oris F0423 TaxID=944562 RepID=A0ABN0D8A0_9LACO|nr:hypothetical protein HMPREF9102_0404 [Limosilactobacillus oris F0423]
MDLLNPFNGLVKFANSLNGQKWYSILGLLLLATLVVVLVYKAYIAYLDHIYPK